MRDVDRHAENVQKDTYNGAFWVVRLWDCFQFSSVLIRVFSFFRNGHVVLLQE